MPQLGSTHFFLHRRPGRDTVRRGNMFRPCGRCGICPPNQAAMTDAAPLFQHTAPSSLWTRAPHRSGPAHAASPPGNCQRHRVGGTGCSHDRGVAEVAFSSSAPQRDITFSTRPCQDSTHHRERVGAKVTTHARPPARGPAPQRSGSGQPQHASVGQEPGEQQPQERAAWAFWALSRAKVVPPASTRPPSRPGGHDVAGFSHRT